MEIQWGIHYYLVNGELLTGKIYTNRYNMALEPSDGSRALIRVLMNGNSITPKVFRLYTHSQDDKS